jgi:hypothetical protein
MNGIKNLKLAVFLFFVEIAQNPSSLHCALEKNVRRIALLLVSIQ